MQINEYQLTGANVQQFYLQLLTTLNIESLHSLLFKSNHETFLLDKNLSDDVSKNILLLTLEFIQEIGQLD